MGIRRLLTTPALAAATVLAAATTVLTAATSAGAVPAGVDQPTHRPPRATLQLRITADPQVSGATLVCGPDGGTHRHAAKACAMLRRAGGNLDRLPDKPRPCTTEYMPVKAAANGHWHGKPVAWERVYGNRCELHAATAWIFRF